MPSYSFGEDGGCGRTQLANGCEIYAIIEGCEVKVNSFSYACVKLAFDCLHHVMPGEKSVETILRYAERAHAARVSASAQTEKPSDHG
jgi:hypothetical protein